MWLLNLEEIRPMTMMITLQFHSIFCQTCQKVLGQDLHHLCLQWVHLNSHLCRNIHSKQYLKDHQLYHQDHHHMIHARDQNLVQADAHNGSLVKGKLALVLYKGEILRMDHASPGERGMFCNTPGTYTQKEQQ